MRWATRTGPHVDRTACAWLIRRSIDPDAEFAFVSDPDELPEDATPHGLDVLMRGLSMVRPDQDVLALSGPLYDGLYEYYKRVEMLGHDRA